MIEGTFAKQPGGILFVATAPGDEEMIKRLPLVGSDGFLFNQALRGARLTNTDQMPLGYLRAQRRETARLVWERRQHSVTYLFKTQVGTFDKSILKGDLTAELNFLTEDVERCKPNVIVPLGPLPLWAFLGTTNLEAYAGAVAVATRVTPGTKLLPTYDPGTVRRAYKMMVVLQADLMKAAKESEHPDVRLPRREIWLDPELADLHAFREQYIRPGIGPLSVDIETGGGQISCLSFSPTAHRSLIVPFLDYRQPDRSYWPTAEDEVQAWAFCSDVLGDETIEKLFQNGGAFDVFWFLDQQGISVVNYRHDLRLVHKTLYPELPASLKFMYRYTQTRAWKAGVSHYEQAKRDA